MPNRHGFTRTAPDSKNVNGLFTATSKKLLRGRRTEPRIYPPLTRAGSTRVDPTLYASTSDVGVSMKFGFASSVKGIRPEARETAEEAARRAGLPLNEWLNTVILQQAAEQGIRAPSLARAGDNSYREDLSNVQARLDDLARRIDQVTRGGAAAYAPRRSREEPDQLAQVIDRFEQRLDRLANPSRAPAPPAIPSTYLPPGIDRAVAEITARRRALNGEPPLAQQTIHAPAAAPLPALASAPSQNLSGLEDQLRRITDQIETLRRPGVEEAINALRGELGEIGRRLNEAMPRRAIETIETQIKNLAQRVAEGRQAGVDSGALAGIERGLAEVRDALRELTPAENLIGYTEAIDALARKIDLIVAQKDPATMHQLHSSIATLREMAAHVASNETMSGLAAQVQVLADKIDRLAIGGGSGDALNKLELRIDALSRAVAERTNNGDAVPPRLEALVQTLSDKIERLQQSRGDAVAFGHLEDRIAKLVERLDASDARLGNLEAIERGIADLLVHIEDLRANKESSALRAENTTGIAAIKHDIARTHDALEAVHGTLDRVVDRLTVIEKDIRGDGQQPAILEREILELTQAVNNATGRTSIDALEPAPLPINVTMQMPATAPESDALALSLVPSPSLSAGMPDLRARPESYTPVDREQLPDQPLEPGSGPPPQGMNPGARIAASEADLGGARPRVATPSERSNFIAAARRAAQAAGQDQKGRPARADTFKARGAEGSALRTKMMTRVKSLFLAASVIAIIIGSIQFASNIFDFGIFDTNDAKIANNAEPDSPDGDMALENNEAETATTLADDQPASPSAPATTPAGADITSSLLVPPTLPGLTPAAPRTNTGSAAIQPPLALSPLPQAPSSMLYPPVSSPPLQGGAPVQKSDVTGSIARAPADAPPNKQPAPPAQAAAADGLPAAIGSVRLRNAAQAGDAAASYEVAMRFVEGRGVPANLEEAARWYERAASKGLAPAQFRYASMLEKGQGVKKDLTAAHKLYVAAASKGNAKAMHNLAVLYAEGAEGKPDYANAAQWFRKAAEYGLADSQYNLGVLAARGLGTEKNITESYKWFALAAAQGDKDAGRKRDEVASHLDAQTLATAQQAVKAFAAQTQPAEASVVPEPSGGWDRTTPSPREKPKSAGALSINAFNYGKL